MSDFICDDRYIWKSAHAAQQKNDEEYNAALREKASRQGRELWDLLDEDGMPLGRLHIRGEKLPHGVLHRVVEIFTVNSRGELLTTLRAPDKMPYPNMWEITGGAVAAGEDSLDAARRELREETGLVVEGGEIEFLLTHRGKYALIDIYLAHKDAEIADLTMQAGETAAAKWVTMPAFEAMIAEGLVPEPVCLRYMITRELLKRELSLPS